MTLDRISRGEYFRIKEIPDKGIRARILRLGIGEGAQAHCHEKIPGGPVIIKKNFQEIAIGRKLAKSITVNK